MCGRQSQNFDIYFSADRRKRSTDLGCVNTIYSPTEQQDIVEKHNFLRAQEVEGNNVTGMMSMVSRFYKLKKSNNKLYCFRT